MKKGEVFELYIKGIAFKGESYGEVDNKKYYVKDCIPGDKVKVKFIKVKSGRNICKVVEKIEKSPNLINSVCDKFGECGGCTYLNLSYEDQLKFKEQLIKDMLIENKIEGKFLGIEKASNQFEYRNKMEFSFGDEFKGGPLELGLHKKGNPFSIVPVYECKLVTKDFRDIMKATVNYFREIGANAYKLKNHEGYLRNLIIRAGKDELMVCLVTSDQNTLDLNGFKEELLKLKLDKKITGIIHVVSNSLSDSIKADNINVLYGRDYIYEEIFGLKFKLNLFSFFQTNTIGMKNLYQKVKEHVNASKGKILDLYCGIGTIGQILSSKDTSVIGVEIVEDAVKMAKENAKLNNLNCEFLLGDAVSVIEGIKEDISFIVVDPPRAGIMRKGVKNICSFNVENIVYVSCNPKTLVEDIKVFEEYNYKVESIECVDMFPNTYHLESVVLMKRYDK